MLFFKRKTKDFSTTKKFPKIMEVDENRMKIIFYTRAVGKPEIKPTAYRYEDILSFTLVEDAVNKVVTRASLSGLFFGYTQNSSGICNSLKLKVVVNDLKKPDIYVKLLAYKTQKSSVLYTNAVKEGREAIAFLEEARIEARIKKSGIKQELIADEIAKLKNLLDNGALTQEEFENEKKRLLSHEEKQA